MKNGFKNTLFQAVIISIIVVTLSLFSVYYLLELIWLDFFSNFLATMLGAIAGIPIAIGISNQLERIKEKNQKEKILPLIKEELFVNVGHLSSWKKSDNQRLEIVYKGILLEDSAWLAFSDSGDLEFIKDPELLKKISHVYGNIRILKQLSERYMDLVYISDETERKILQTPIGYLIVRGIDEALEDISVALKFLY